MATILNGNKSALLVVDAQVGAMADVWDYARIVQNIKTAIEKARKEGIPVIWVQHADTELVQDSADWQIVPELTPSDGEIRIYKNFNSSFEETPLEDALVKLGVSHIVLAGACTNWCIRATAYGALDRGYDLTLLKDGYTTVDTVLKDGSKIAAKDVATDLNISMAWLNYPGRKNTAVSAADLDFSKTL